MALSDYEKRVLAEMEQHLRQQDPDLADKMASTIPADETPEPKSELSPRKIALGSILAAAGLGAVLIGVTVGNVVATILLGALGFAMMVGGVLLALSSDKSSGKASLSETSRQSRPSPKPRVDKQAERRRRWENR